MLNYSYLTISIAIIGTTISTLLIAISIYHSGNYYTGLSIAAIVLIILDLLLITFNKKSIQIQEYDIPDLDPGFYFIKIKEDKNTKFKKFIKF